MYTMGSDLLIHDGLLSPTTMGLKKSDTTGPVEKSTYRGSDHLSKRDSPDRQEEPGTS